MCGLSGGVDSTVAAMLVHRAIGDRLTCIFVDNGLLRLDEAEQVRRRFARLQLPLDFVDASATVSSSGWPASPIPEQKRKTIGAAFIDVFERRAQELGGFDFLAQGTLYPDVIESVSVVGPSAAIKSHHNVGGLPERMHFKLVEPLRLLFKDEVREVGKALGLEDEFVWRQPFPGPGLAVRLLGPDHARPASTCSGSADAIVADEIRKAGWYRRLWQSFAVLLPVQSVGVMGDERHVRASRGDSRGREPRRHDGRLGAPAARTAGPDVVAHRERSPRRQSRRVRHQLEAAGDDRVGMIARAASAARHCA